MEVVILLPLVYVMVVGNLLLSGCYGNVDDCGAGHEISFMSGLPKITSAGTPEMTSVDQKWALQIEHVNNDVSDYIKRPVAWIDADMVGCHTDIGV